MDLTIFRLRGLKEIPPREKIDNFMSHIIIIFDPLISDILLFNFLVGSTLLIKIRKINVSYFGLFY